MDLTKLKVGETVKNYKELCLLLGVSTKTGKSKQIQLAEFELHFKYSKAGHCFIIEDIYNVPQEKETKRFGMVNYIEELILNLLVSKKGRVFLPKSQLFKVLNMVNDNYNFGRYNIGKLSKYLQIPEDNIYEFYELTSNTLQRAIEGGLNRLSNKSLVFWSPSKTVCVANVETRFNKNLQVKLHKETTYNHYEEKTNVYNPIMRTYEEHREATDKEVKAILHTERLILMELNCEDKSVAIRKGKWEVFRERVDQILFDQYNIVYYYDSYKIIFNEEHINEVKLELSKLTLNDDTRLATERTLNDKVICTLGQNDIVRIEKAKEKLADETLKNRDRYLRRVDDTYLEDNKELIDNLIDDEPKESPSSFRKNVRRIKTKVFNI
ncbi:hypothetical protein A616_17265 [Brevibacillus brevis X23]|nr:hypothetical protein A616_17265 [Brevibacillus brevis X23]